jgi:transposase-like protein
MFEKTEFKTILDLVTKFPDEKSCHQYLAAQRWEGLLECPFNGCESEKAYIFTDGIRYKCCKCKKIFTAKTGSFMEASKLPTIKWFLAMFFVSHKKGISSIQLGTDLGVTQKTAWFMLQRIREGLGNGPDVQLEGVIASDETFCGGKNKNRHHDKKVANSQGRAFIDKTPVLGLMQTEVNHIIERPHKIIPTRVVKEKIIDKPAVLKCWVIPNTKGSVIQPLVRANVKPGSIIVSDEWWAYSGLSDAYQHEIVDHARKQYVNDNGFSSNAMECGWKHFKLTIVATHHWVSRKHLNKYTNEFVFRQNNRNLGLQDQINGIIKTMNFRLRYKDLVA